MYETMKKEAVSAIQSQAQSYSFCLSLSLSSFGFATHTHYLHLFSQFNPNCTICFRAFTKS